VLFGATLVGDVAGEPPQLGGHLVEAHESGEASLRERLLRQPVGNSHQIHLRSVGLSCDATRW
jgi:hypothetical protein